MKKSCIVGFGEIGLYHSKLFNELPFAELYAVCDIEEKKLKRAANLFHGVKCFRNYDDVLEDVNIDVIHICTPHHLHCEMVEKALSAGKDVLLEKPVCINIDEFNRIKRAEEKSSNILGIILQNRINPTTRKMLAELTNIGKLLGVSGRVLWSRDEKYYNMDEWRGKWRTEGGGVMINQAIHTFDILGYITGGFTSVFGSISTKKLGNIIEVEDTADAHLETAMGADAIFYASNCYPVNTPVMIEITGEYATLRLEDNHLYKIQNGKAELIESDIKNESLKSYWGIGHKAVFYNFYKYLEVGEGAYTTLKDTENTMKTIFALYESAKRNERVEII